MEDDDDNHRNPAASVDEGSCANDRSPSWNAAASGNVDDNINNMNDDPTFGSHNNSTSNVRDELPYLVTNYLAHYETKATATNNPIAVERIRKAAIELAQAFESLGAFGMATRPRLMGNSLESDGDLSISTSTRMLVDEPLPPSSSSSGGLAVVPAKFADVHRQWRCQPDQLERLVGVAVSTGSSLVQQHQEVQGPQHLMQRAHEILLEERQNRTTRPTAAATTTTTNGTTTTTTAATTASGAAAGRTLDELTTNVHATHAQRAPIVQSSFVEPIVVRGQPLATTVNIVATTGTATSEDQQKQPPRTGGIVLVSELEHQFQQAGSAIRSLLDLHNKIKHNERQLQVSQQSMQLHQITHEQLMIQKQQLNTVHDTTLRLRIMDEIQENEQNCTRVLAQLERQCQSLQQRLLVDSKQLVERKQAAQSAHTSIQIFRRGYRDPLLSSNPLLQVGKPIRNHLLMSLLDREKGMSRFLKRGINNQSSSSQAVVVSRTCRALLLSRMSHAATINTHLAYPIYCLRFDKTGRYFVTGADDYLVRVFYCSGSPVTPRSPSASTSSSHAHASGVAASHELAAARGAVLVCTLRGHAGVINDIDVSSDNGLLATASEDGDCRIWGLKDGCPVAILRGHVGGANMVSWSTLTPFRLVTTGADGYARTWDVREACLKRYGKVIGKRPEYRLALPASQPRHTAVSTDGSTVGTPGLTSRSEPSSSPMQARGTIGDASDTQPNPNAVPLPPLPAVPLPVPPLPPAAAPINDAANREEDEEIDPGSFVANDILDEGVTLLFKLKHGAYHDDTAGSPAGARSRRSPIKVICLSRCPHGGHFATGSDDGVCRVWKDDDDPAVQMIDGRCLRHAPSLNASSITEPASSTPRLLLTLKSHDSAITDLQYSNAGDRLLTASQKDGVVKIFSWQCDPSIERDSRSPPVKTSFISIHLTNPRSAGASGRTPAQASRRRPRSGGSSSSVSCDVASWICDDTKIVTAQSELVKQSGTEINPGSQYIFLWDSITGSCLMGIAGAHEKQCPGVIPHTSDPNIMCSIGADGFMKLWDCESGKVFFSYENVLEFGPVDPNDRDKPCGFLDGAFSPDGTCLVLTDDYGRVTVFDCAGFVRERSDTPEWMREQYFANDYYELLYDSNGYCIERGSELPPHLAPTGVRCSHGGIPHPDAITAAFKTLTGPLPLSEYHCRYQRLRTVALHRQALDRRLEIPGVKVGRFDPETTILITGTGHSTIVGANVLPSESVPQSRMVRNERTRGPRLSSNWRWSDYDDMLMREDALDDDAVDSDDEEYQQAEGSRPGRANSDDESDSDSSTEMPDSPAPNRLRGRRYQAIDSDSSGSDMIEFMSTNKTPSGAFAQDYETHLFRTASNATILREWLMRTESNSGYAGRKLYVPQLGDCVVYIPQAHQETLNQYPRLRRPWHKWPAEVNWPVVQCCIRHMRYRFPIKEYFKQRHGKMRSVVILLTLEITGVPEASVCRNLGWPAPVFTNPGENIVFELSLFLSESDDFLLPFGLYEQRLSRLEAFGKEGSWVDGFYKASESQAQESQDPGLLPYRGQIESFEPNAPTNSFDPRIQGSGYHSIVVKWEGNGGGEDQLSPWEVDVIADEVDAPMRGRLTEGEKRTIQSALTALKEKDQDVETTFFQPVDQSRYTDYLNMIEVPIDLSFISQRVESDYYSSMLSVVSDVKVVRDNCIKYNGPDDDLAKLSVSIFDSFAKLVLSDEDLKFLQDFDDLAQSNLVAWSLQPPESILMSLPAPASSRSIHRVQGGNENRGVRIRRQRPPAANQSMETNHRQLRSRDSGLIPRQASLRPNLRSTATGAPAPRRRNIGHRRSGAQDDQREQYQRVPGRRARRRRTGQSTAGVNRDPTEGTRQSRPASDRTQGRTLGNPIAEAPRPRLRQPRIRASEHLSQVTNEVQTSTRLTRNSRTLSSDSPAQNVPVRRSSRSSFSFRNYAQASSASDESDGEVVTGRNQDPRRQTRSTFSDFELNGRTRQRSTRRVARHEETSGNSDEDAVQQTSNTRSLEPTNAESSEENASASENSSASESEGEVKTSSDEEVDGESDDSDEKAPAARPHRPRGSRHEPVMSPTRSSPRRGVSQNSTWEPESPGSPRRANLRNTKAKRIQYQELSESDFTDSHHDDDDDDEASATASKKRKTALRGHQRPNKQAKLNGSHTDVEKPRVWPDIDLKKITSVGEGIIGRLGAVDEEGIFAIPVAEAYPELAKAYKRTIKHPMDFRTILEERLPAYTSISELQRDLLLTFENCMEFNKAGSDYYALAKSMIEMLDDVFMSVCADCKQHLPRRW